MKIIHIPRRFTTRSWGGTETVVLESASEQIAQGHQAHIMCSNALAEQNDENIQSVPVSRFNYFYPYLGLSASNRKMLDYKGGNMFSFSLLSRLLKEPDVDLIHLHTSKRMGGIGRYCARNKNIPYVVTLHGGLFDVPSAESAAMLNPTRNTLEWGKMLGFWVGSRRVMDEASAIFCIGKGEFDEVSRRYPEKKIELFSNSVNCKKFEKGDGPAFRSQHNISPDKKLILIVGRIDPQKNQQFAITVFEELVREIPNLHLAIVGHITHDDYHQSITDTIKQHQLEQQITVVRGVDFFSKDLVNAYHAADIFCLPSIHEPFGVVILEAWAAKKPVIASRVGGIPSFVEHEQDGLLCRVNVKEDFIRGIRTILTSKKMRVSLAENGYHKAKTEFSWESNTTKLLTLYEEIIRENHIH